MVEFSRVVDDVLQSREAVLCHGEVGHPGIDFPIAVEGDGDGFDGGGFEVRKEVRRGGFGRRFDDVFDSFGDRAEEAVYFGFVLFNPGTLGHETGIGNFSGGFADGSDDIAFSGGLVFGGDGLEHGAVVGGAGFESAGHEVECDVEIEGDVSAVVKSVLIEDVFEGHSGDAALSAGEDFLAFEVGPFEVGFVYSRHEEGAVALGELSEYGGDVRGAADEDIERGFGAAESYIGVAGEDGGHDFIGAAAVGEFYFQVFLFEIAERVGEVERGIEDGMSDFVDFEFCEASVVLAAGRERKEKEAGGKCDCRNFFHRGNSVKI